CARRPAGIYGLDS
nr:immunoglobulin heavy chain junction region [Macaca mulatta]